MGVIMKIHNLSGGLIVRDQTDGSVSIVYNQTSRTPPFGDEMEDYEQFGTELVTHYVE